ncbi:MAG TPA: hypothetical protein VEA44_12850 [Caulobacter sp.]|nr:hypothetical protein [Caulobacter sp.]
MQRAVEKLLKIAPKITDDLDETTLDALMDQLDALQRPVSEADVAGLISLFPAEGDTGYGLNWTVLHAIEACEAWPIWSLLEDRSNEWIDRLAIRLANAGLHPPG